VPAAVKVKGDQKEQENSDGSEGCPICIPVPPIIEVPVPV
jgi:hypothetical protein